MNDGVARPTSAAGGWAEGEFSGWRHFPRPPLRLWFWWTLAAFVILSALWIAGMTVRFYVRDYYAFVPDYIRWMRAPSGETVAGGAPTHVFLIFVDHFEPDYDPDAVTRWVSRYRVLATRHHDSDGRPPQHTWFYPGEQESKAILDILGDAVASGLGEVELHFHHDFDTYDSLKPRLEDTIASFQTHGFLKTVDGRTRFAFIHGNSGLDNSNGPVMCGVNDEIRLLRELGCFADFTFPSIYEPSQPPFVNSIYAARDDPAPQSYRHQFPLTDLVDGRADLMIFEGPLVFARSWSLRHLFVDLDDGDIHAAVPPSPARADRWVEADVHVAGRPDWRFIKIFGHTVSASGDEDAALGRQFDQTLSYLEHEYNDGRNYILHYITAREAYNLAMAAATHATGSPERYYDYVVKPYVADASRTVPLR